MDEYKGCKYCCWSIDDHEHENNLQSIIDDKVIPLRAKIKFGVLGRNGSEVPDVITGDGTINLDTEVRLTAAIFDKGQLYVTVDEECWDNPIFETRKDRKYENDPEIAGEIVKFNFCPMCGRYIAGDS